MKNSLKYLVYLLLLFVFSCTAVKKTTVEGNSENLKNAKLVDVRSPEQFKQSPVKNAVNIPLAEIENNLDFFRKQNRTVIFCNTGRQSGEAFKVLKDNGIKNIYNAKTWKNVYAMQTNFLNQLVFSKEKPSTYVIKKTDKIQQIVVGLGEETLLKKHITPVPTNLVMVKGSILFKINGEEYHFGEGDTYEIPVNTEHEVVGKGKENVFILTKEL